MFFLHWNGSFFRRLDTPHETMMWWRWWWWWSCFCTPITINKKIQKNTTTCILTRKTLLIFRQKRMQPSHTIFYFINNIGPGGTLCAYIHIRSSVHYFTSHEKGRQTSRASNIFAYEVLCIKHNGFLPSYPTYSFHQHHHGSSVIRPYSIQNLPSFSFPSLLFVRKLGDWRGEIETTNILFLWVLFYVLSPVTTVRELFYYELVNKCTYAQFIPIIMMKD